MKLKCLTAAGFRGFNAEQSIHFHDKLTVIAAPNSHGKTSISEALEFLIYGTTSKVDKANCSSRVPGQKETENAEQGHDSYKCCGLVC